MPVTCVCLPQFIEVWQSTLVPAIATMEKQIFAQAENKDVPVL